jgi:hypothetical protein
MVGRGVIVWVGGICVGLGVNVAATVVGVSDGEGDGALSNVPVEQPVKIKIPKSSASKMCFIVCLPLIFLLVSFFALFLLSKRNFSIPCSTQKLTADR